MSLRYPSLVAAILLAGTSAVHAVRQAPAAAPEPAKDAKPALPKNNEPVPPYELKNRSSFSNSAEASRAPFWPIGWVKRSKASTTAAVQPQVEAPKVTLDAKSFKVTSILLGSGTTPSLAVINGRAYSEGEFIRAPRTPGATGAPVAPSAPSARVRVQHIADGTVILQNGEQTLTVPLTRPQLSNPKPEILLNDQDR